MRFPRGIFLNAAAGSFAAVALVRAPAKAAEFDYKSGHPNSETHPMHVWSVRLWDQVAKETNGRLVVKVYPNSSLGGQEALLSQTRLGAIQFCSIIDTAYSEVVPVAAIDSVGFAFKDYRAPWYAMTGRLGDYVRREFEAKGLIIPSRFGIFDLGLRQITSSTKPIRTGADFAGFKVRVPPGRISIDLFKTLGASPVALSANEVYSAMQTHVVDGQETPFVTIYQNHYYEVQKFLSVTNHMWTGEWYVMNLAAWKALPSDIQRVVERNYARYMPQARDDSWQQNLTLADKLKSVGLTFNDANTQSMRATLGPYYARWKSEFGPTAWGLLESSVGRLG
jgi:TRAP-type transport system periplasmic protein